MMMMVLDNNVVVDVDDELHLFVFEHIVQHHANFE
jgi:hypothetical protein